MKSHILSHQPRLFQGFGNTSIAGLQVAICLMAIAWSSVTARAAWPWFSGYLNPANSYRIYAYTDWDESLFGVGIYPDTDCLGVAPPNYRVDGHVVLEADGTGNCVVIASTGSHMATEPVGSIYPVSFQFANWFSNPASAPASDTRHDYSSAFLNILSDPVPSLTIALSGTNCLLFWPTNAPGYSLQSSTNLLAVSWPDVTNSAVIVSDDYSVILSATQQKSFFRLKK
jgi:hypothetical protein